jgi:DNA replication and repair protein RecF
MRLTTLHLQHFRNHLDSSFDFGDGTNILLGDNGQGKTNVLEAISYLCLTKSFFAGNDALVVTFDHALFEVEGTFVSDRTGEQRVRVAYGRELDEKRYLLNQHAAETFSSVIGRFPVVICSPEHGPVTSAGPAERRKFVDLVISQSNAAYFQSLLEYRRVLKQRNKILLDAKLAGRGASGELEPWDEQLATHGSYLIVRRKRFVEEFQPVIASAYRRIAGADEVPTIAYRPLARLVECTSEEEIRALLLEELREKASEEARYGLTLTGPHRDEFAMKLNGLDLRKYASQGQHKTFLIALKIGEFFYLQERCGETPILLLDDIFSELDEHRAAELLEFVETLSQTFITSTSAQLFSDRLGVDIRNRMFAIRNGAVERYVGASV